MTSSLFILTPRFLENTLLSHHDLDELFIVDLAITVNVGLAEHLVNLLISQLLTKVGHDVAQLGSGDKAIAVLVKHAEGFLELLLGICVLHLASHQGAEFRKVDGAIAIGINLVDHVRAAQLLSGSGRASASRYQA